MATPPLTILAPTHNRPDVLQRVWPTWVVQQGLKEIVVVDDGSTVDYTSVFADLAERCKRMDIALKVLRLSKRVGAPAARNAGLAACTSEEVFTTDDDVVFAPDMIERCREERPQRELPVIVGPRVIYLRDGETEEQADARSRADTQPYFRASDLTLTPWVDPGRALRMPFVTALTLWPRSLFVDGLRYCEEYGGNGYREETDPQVQAQARFGAEVYLTPSARSFHLPPAIAYSKAGGQRRGGRLWFEYWVHRNNARFLKRNAEPIWRLTSRSAVACWFSLASSRVIRKPVSALSGLVSR
jgi:glycosyltransferase involved in cell wall biosynthesis